MKARPAYEIGFAWLDTSPRTPRKAHPTQQQSAARTPPRRSTPQTRAPRTTATRAATTRAALANTTAPSSRVESTTTVESGGRGVHNSSTAPRTATRAAAPDNSSASGEAWHGGKALANSKRVADDAVTLTRRRSVTPSELAVVSRCACASKLGSPRPQTAPSSSPLSSPAARPSRSAAVLKASTDRTASSLSSPAARPSPLRTALSSPRSSTASPRLAHPHRWGGAPHSQQVAGRSANPDPDPNPNLTLTPHPNPNPNLTLTPHSQQEAVPSAVLTRAPAHASVRQPVRFEVQARDS